MHKTSNEGKRRERAFAKEYRGTDKGRERLNAASQSYHRTEKGRARKSAASQEYYRTEKGRARMSAASQAYHRTEKGKARMSASFKKYRSTEKGRARESAASQEYHRTEKGRARMRAASQEYHRTEKGRARMRAATQEYRGTDKGRQQERRRYRRNNLYREFKEDVDPSQFDYGTSRNAVFKSIKEHNIAPGYLSKFSRLKSEIIKGKKTMYLPNLPADFNAQHKRGLFRSNNRFARSKNRKHWKISASNIFIKNVDAAMIDEVLQLWFPITANLSIIRKSLSPVKLLVEHCTSVTCG